MPAWFLVANFLSFQAIWLIAVLAGNGSALALCVPIIFLHFLLMDRALKKHFNWKNEFLLIIACLVIGGGVESFKLLLPIWDSALVGHLPPLWLMTIWAGFAISLHGSFAFLYKRFALASLMGAIFAPLSYLAGAHLSDTYAFVDASFGVVLIGMVWMVVMPLLVWVAGLLPAQKAQRVQTLTHNASAISAI
ncbi:DUF2878 domain-containing protein [Marinagarivorans algicola]|uniref:DUF2878 domain-containing protein n=1 Tax=Marinagarivorans algicola TaxID=1513270 RepID=UPI001EE427D7|nr:DUF2878 domain-containing protein [Marinagarivorans algicola]